LGIVSFLSAQSKLLRASLAESVSSRRGWTCATHSLNPRRWPGNVDPNTQPTPSHTPVLLHLFSDCPSISKPIATRTAFLVTYMMARLRWVHAIPILRFPAPFTRARPLGHAVICFIHQLTVIAEDQFRTCNLQLLTRPAQLQDTSEIRTFMRFYCNPLGQSLSRPPNGQQSVLCKRCTASLVTLAMESSFSLPNLVMRHAQRHFGPRASRSLLGYKYFWMVDRTPQYRDG
jgi:hypothetical protein